MLCLELAAVDLLRRFVRARLRPATAPRATGRSEFDGAPGCAVLVNAQTETGASALNLPTGPVTSYEQLHGNWIKSADCETAGFEGDEGAVNCICQKIV